MADAANPQLAEWEQRLFRLRQESEALAAPLRQNQLDWHPGPGRWSVGECFDHLTLATGLMLTRVRPAIDRGHLRGIRGAPPFRYGLMGSWFVRAMAQPPKPGKRQLKSPGNFVPTAGLPKHELLQQYTSVLGDLSATLDRAHGLALDRLKARSAAQGGWWLRLNVAAWLAGTIAHLDRHLAQARRVTGTPGFPR